MKTIIDKNTGKVLYCRLDEPTLENEVAIDAIYEGNIQETDDLYWDEEKGEFILKNTTHDDN